MLRPYANINIWSFLIVEVKTSFTKTKTWNIRGRKFAKLTERICFSRIKAKLSTFSLNWLFVGVTRDELAASSPVCSSASSRCLTAPLCVPGAGGGRAFSPPCSNHNKAEETLFQLFVSFRDDQQE